MGVITNNENKLFKLWSQNRPGFVSDGVVCEDSYISAKIKIVYILKEVNDIDGGNWDLREFVRNGARANTWNNITRWTLGIINIDKELCWDEIENITIEQRKKYLKSICVINLKKTPGNYVCNEDELCRIAKEDKLYLKKQISLYDPDLIICCGTSDIYHSIFNEPVEWKRTNRGIWYYEYKKDKYLISYLHPEARVRDNLLFYGLIDAIKEIKGIEK
ncbi:hypothetical protein [Caloranaerobacter ferrireducens]|uniref:hypothetical protein n=1 Tax=Caloranaerobacter ferrireducens TaxID=1323370 RepID=UPI00084D62F1|nr:hypothetical protein [Caloranaerobacter ferrireducens]